MRNSKPHRTIVNIVIAIAVLALPALQGEGAKADATRERATTMAAKNTKKKKAPRRCPVRAATLLGQYFEKGEHRCFKKAARATSAGLVLGSLEQQRPRRRKANRCSFVAFPPSGLFFRQKDTQCFRSAVRAERKGFVKFAAATPQPTVPAQGTISTTPDPTPTGTPDTNPQGSTPTPGPSSTPVPGGETPIPTPTPTTEVPDGTPTTAPATPTSTPTPSGTYPPAGDPITYTFQLHPAEPGNGYSGDCTALFSGDRTQLTLNCTHNVTTPSEVHLHIIPMNEAFCRLPEPASPFQIDCNLTPAQSAGVLSGWGLVAIHLASGGENQAANGYIRNTP